MDFYEIIIYAMITVPAFFVAYQGLVGCVDGLVEYLRKDLRDDQQDLVDYKKLIGVVVASAVFWLAIWIVSSSTDGFKTIVCA